MFVPKWHLQTSVRLVLCALVVVLSVSGPWVFAYPTVYPTGTTIYEPDKASPGYTIYNTIDTPDVVLIDMEGNLLNVWQVEGLRLTYSEPLANGNLLGRANRGGDWGLVELDWDSNVVWEIFFPIHERQVHHDFERLENGNTLILCSSMRFVPRISRLVTDDHIIEVDPTGQIVWEWYTLDHFEEFGFDNETLTLIEENLDRLGGDWAHANSIQSLPENTLGDARFEKGNILVSQRHTNIIFVIDKDTGTIVWRVGPDDNLTIGQHDAQMIEMGLPGAGNILVFDNGGISGYPEEARFNSRIVEISPIDKQIVRAYSAIASGLPRDTFFSPFMSSVQRLPNGNTLIDEGNTGRFFEATSTGEIAWEYVNPREAIRDEVTHRQVYRIRRVPLDWIY